MQLTEVEQGIYFKNTESDAIHLQRFQSLMMVAILKIIKNGAN